MTHGEGVFQFLTPIFAMFIHFSKSIFVEQKKAHRHRVQCSLQGFLLTFRQLHIYIFLRAWLDEMPLRHPVNRAFQYMSLLGYLYSMIAAIWSRGVRFRYHATMPLSRFNPKSLEANRGSGHVLASSLSISQSLGSL